MADGNSGGKPTVAAPYTAFQSLKTLLKGFKDHNSVPGRIDRTVLSNFSNAVGSQILTALRFLGLIDSDNHPAPALEELVRAYGTDDWPKLLADVLRKAYRPLFELNLETASPGQFNEKFRASYAGTDEVQRKSMTFFLNATRDAGIKVSSYIMKNKKPRGPTKARKKTANGSPDGQGREEPEEEEEQSDLPSPPAGGKGAAKAAEQKPSSLYDALLAMLDPKGMNEAEQNAVWTLLLYLKKKETEAPAKAS